jgi:hypothetical protein
MRESCGLVNSVYSLVLLQAQALEVAETTDYPRPGLAVDVTSINSAHSVKISIFLPQIG